MQINRNCTSCGRVHHYERNLCYGCYKVLMQKPNCTCKVCNKEFYELPARIKQGRGQFCSRHCRLIGLGAKTIQTECEQCHKPFVYIEKKFKECRKFCSNKCNTDSYIGKPHQISEEGMQKLIAKNKARKGKSIKRVKLDGYRTPEHREYCRKRRLSQTFLKQDTDIELILKEVLDKEGLKYEHPYVLDGKFVCDFGFPEVKVIVECDGSYWHSLPRNRHFDKLKNNYIPKIGWTILRFSDVDIKQKIDLVIREIKNTIVFKHIAQNNLATMLGIRK